MNTQEKENLIVQNEIDLFDLLKVIVKRRRFIIVLFLVSVMLTAGISMLMPKVYRGEVVLRTVPKEIIVSNVPFKMKESIGNIMSVTMEKTILAKDIIDSIGKVNRDKIEAIFPRNSASVVELKIMEVKQSKYSFKVIIESKREEDIEGFLMDFLEYLRNFTLIKRIVDRENDLLKKQIDEISILISEGDNLSQNILKMIKEKKVLSLGFDPIEPNKKVSDLRVEKFKLEQTLQDNKGVEMFSEPYISRKPVKPKVVKGIIIAGLISLSVGISLAIFMENREKIRSGKKLREN